MYTVKMIEGGRFVHFPDGDGRVHEGEIVAAWLPSPTEPDDPSQIRVTVACTDQRFRDAWLINCIDGSMPRPKKGDE